MFYLLFKIIYNVGVKNLLINPGLSFAIKFINLPIFSLFAAPTSLK